MSKFSWQILQHTVQTSMHHDKSMLGTLEGAKNQYKIIADNADFERITIYMKGDFVVDRSKEGTMLKNLRLSLMIDLSTKLPYFYSWTPFMKHYLV